ncbi:Forkhead box protein J3 [Madurella mycetomatis]|uniref:Forkhead box protein J3 n=1 Tax=Madurella mycetomatis TaxID=100816 RepID=A0A175WCJ9_9PEZI|nr:Forkhead box protein J3 [Madurella mycetomatis]
MSLDSLYCMGDPEYLSTLLTSNRLTVDPGLDGEPSRLARHAEEAQSPREVPTVSNPEAVNSSPPQKLTQMNPTSNARSSRPQFVGEMVGLMSGGGRDSRRAYVTSHVRGGPAWSVPLGTLKGNDGPENYTLDSSPAVTSLQRHVGSAQSSPRSWSSSDQIQVGPAGWEPASEPLQNAYHTLDPQTPSLPQRDGSFVQNSSIQVSSAFPADTFQSSDALGSEFRAGYLASPEDGGSSTPGSCHPLSPCSIALGASGEEGAPSPIPGLAAIDDVAVVQALNVSVAESHSQYDSKSSPTSGSSAPNDASTNTKNEEPYAQLIYRALMSNPRYAMTLQEIYQWFRENTDKDKNDSSKGWMNSIRHNLSMNQAFTKRDRKSTSSKGGDTEKGSAKAALSSISSQSDNKKSTEWYLEPWAIEEGVQSTTRYRKGGQSGRSAGRYRGTLFSTRSYGGTQLGNGRDFSRYGSADRKRGRIMRHTPVHNAAAATASQIQHYHLAHHNHQQLLHSPISDASAYTHYFANGTRHVQMVDVGSGGVINRAAIDLDLDFPGSRTFQSAAAPDHHHHQHHHQHQRARSDLTVDEPATPEPLPYGDESGLPLPDLRAAAQSSSSTGAGAGGLYYTTGEGHNHSGGGVVPQLTSYVPQGATYENVYIFGGLDVADGQPVYQPHAF